MIGVWVVRRVSRLPLHASRSTSQQREVRDPWDLAAVGDRRSLLDLAASGTRALIDANACLLYEVDDSDSSLRLAASAPALGISGDGKRAAPAIELVEARGDASHAVLDDLAAALELDSVPAAADAVSLMATGRRLGALVAISQQPLGRIGIRALPRGRAAARPSNPADRVD